MQSINLNMNDGNTIVVNRIDSFDEMATEEPLLTGVQHYVASCIKNKDYMHQVTDLNSNKEYVINVFNISSIIVK